MPQNLLAPRRKTDSLASHQEQYALFKRKFHATIYRILKEIFTRTETRDEQYQQILGELLKVTLNDLLQLEPPEWINHFDPGQVDALNKYVLNQAISDQLKSDLHYFNTEFEHCRQVIKFFLNEIQTVPKGNIFRHSTEEIISARRAWSSFRKVRLQGVHKSMVTPTLTWEANNYLQAFRTLTYSFLTQRLRKIPDFANPLTDEEYAECVVTAFTTLISKIKREFNDFLVKDLGRDGHTVIRVNGELDRLVPAGRVFPCIQQKFLDYLCEVDGVQKALHFTRGRKKYETYANDFFKQYPLANYLPSYATAATLERQMELFVSKTRQFFEKLDEVVQRTLDGIIYVEIDDSYLSPIEGDKGKKGWQAQFETVLQLVNNDEDPFLRLRIHLLFSEKAKKGALYNQAVKALESEKPQLTEQAYQRKVLEHCMGSLCEQQQAVLSALKEYLNVALQRFIKGDNNLPHITKDMPPLARHVVTRARDSFQCFSDLHDSVIKKRATLNVEVRHFNFIDRVATSITNCVEQKSKPTLDWYSLSKKQFTGAVANHLLRFVDPLNVSDINDFCTSYVIPLLSSLKSSSTSTSLDQTKHTIEAVELNVQLQSLIKLEKKEGLNRTERLQVLPWIVFQLGLMDDIVRRYRKFHPECEATLAYLNSEIMNNGQSPYRLMKELDDKVLEDIETFVRPTVKKFFQKIHKFILNTVAQESKTNPGNPLTIDQETIRDLSQEIGLWILVRNSHITFDKALVEGKLGDAKEVLGIWKEGQESIFPKLDRRNTSQMQAYDGAANEYKAAFDTLNQAFAQFSERAPTLGSGRVTASWTQLRDRVSGLTQTNVAGFIKDLKQFINVDARSMSDNTSPKESALLLFNTLCLRRALTNVLKVKFKIAPAEIESKLTVFLSTNEAFVAYLEKSGTKEALARPNLDYRKVANAMAGSIKALDDLERVNYRAVMNAVQLDRYEHHR